KGIQKFVDSFSEPLRIRESKPVIVHDARFVVVAQTDWKPGKPSRGLPVAAPIEIQLHITNLSKNEVLFPTFDTFGIRILTADGNELKPHGKPNGANPTAPLLLPAGASYALCRRAERSEEHTSEL